MRRIQSYKGMSRPKKKKLPWYYLVIALGVVLFVIGFVWLRSGDRKQDVIDEMTDDLFAGSTETLETDIEPSVPTMEAKETIDLEDVTGGDSVGIATREIQDGLFRHTVKATLPDSAEDEFYEGWLVRGTPFDFFSTGDMVTISTGEYVLEWFSGEAGPGSAWGEYADYTQVVITLEPDDGDPAPAAHVLEGEF